MEKVKEKFPLNTEVYKNMLNEFSRLIFVVGYNNENNSYLNAVQEFLHYLEVNQKLDITKVKSLDLVAYYEYLSTRSSLVDPNKQLKFTTVCSHLHTLNLLFEYLLHNQVIKSVVVLPSRPVGLERNPQILSQEEIKTIFSNINKKRDYAFLSIAYGCGLRRAEIVDLNVSDVLLKNGILIVRKGKNGKRREIPLSNSIIQSIENYLFSDRDNYLKANTISTAFFLSNQGKRMTGLQIYSLFKKLVKNTKNQKLIDKKITLHSLRHSISSHLMDNGANIEYIKEFLGHADIDTSHIYTRNRKRTNLILKHF